MKKRVYYLLFFIFILASFDSIDAQKTILVSEDTYVFSKGGADNAILRHIENPSELKSYRHQSDDRWTYKTYLKFDLSSINSNPDLIDNVTFKILGKEDQGSFIHKISLYTLSENSWSEDELSYNSRSAVGTETRVQTIEQTIGQTDVWLSLDITTVVKDYKSRGLNTLSLMLCDDTNVRNPSNSQGSVITFRSKEASNNNAARLEVVEQNISELLLSDIKLNGNSIEDFLPEIFHYNIDINPEWSSVPVIEVTKVDANSIVMITNAKSLTGSEEDRTTLITVEKDGKSLSYSLTFVESVLTNNATLKNIQIDGIDLEFFKSETNTYKYFYPYSFNGSPTISIDKDNKNQTVTVNQPVDILSENENDRIATIEVTSSDKSLQSVYTLHFEVLPKLDLFLCIGQSNMAGRGYMNSSLGDNISLGNSFLLTPQAQVIEANNPMNQYSNIRKELSLQEISPAWGFAKYLNDNLPHIKTGMIVNARGGTAIEEWQKGQSLYNQTVERTQEALKWGDLKGIIWHQGESNTASAKIQAYPNQLKKMVADLRSDLSAPDAYFIAGELIHTWSNSANFNVMIQTISSFLPNSEWVSAENLKPRASGDVHFDREGNIELGIRYAKKMIDKLYQSQSIQKSNSSSMLDIDVIKNTVRIHNIEVDSLILIYNMYGKKVFSTNTIGDTHFQLNQEGVYLLVVENEMYSISKKIIIN